MSGRKGKGYRGCIETFSNDIVDIYSRKLSGLLFFCYSLRKKWLITILSVESSECMFSWEKIERITFIMAKHTVSSIRTTLMNIPDEFPSAVR